MEDHAEYRNEVWLGDGESESDPRSQGGRGTKEEGKLTLISGFSKNCKMTFLMYSKLRASSADPFARAFPDKPPAPVAALAREETLAAGEIT